MAFVDISEQQKRREALKGDIGGGQLAQSIVGAFSQQDRTQRLDERTALAQKQAEATEATRLGERAEDIGLKKDVARLSVEKEERAAKRAEKKAERISQKASEKESLSLVADTEKKIAGLRKEISGNPLTRDTQKVATSLKKIESAAKLKTAAGDLSLIFSFMKILDPGSVVREGEFANAQNAAGVPERVRNMFNKVKSGQRLGDNQRSDFTNTARQNANAQIEQFNLSIKPQLEAIKAGNLPGEQIVPGGLTIQEGRTQLAEQPQETPAPTELPSFLSRVDARSVKPQKGVNASGAQQMTREEKIRFLRGQ